MDLFGFLIPLETVASSRFSFHPPVNGAPSIHHLKADRKKEAPDQTRRSKRCRVIRARLSIEYHFLFQGLKDNRDTISGHVPSNVIALSSSVTIAEGFSIGHSIAANHGGS